MNVKFNTNAKLILADVDNTVADTYTPAKPEMINELTNLLEEDRVIFFVSGAGLNRITSHVTDLLPPQLRSKVLVSHCSGAEVIGFDESGDILEAPIYSLYDEILSETQKTKWRVIVDKVIDEFKLIKHPSSTVLDFKNKYGDNPLDIMLEDRGPQITLEFVNGYDMSVEQQSELEELIPLSGSVDLRVPVLERFDVLLKQSNMPITPRFGGIFALDLALKGVSNTNSLKHLLEDRNLLNKLGLSEMDVENPDNIEIWGDRFNRFEGGTDRHMQEAVDPKVRSINFRQENPEGFLPGYNIVLWDGEQNLEDGLLEYLQTRR